MSTTTETTYTHRLIALLALCGVSTSIGVFMKLSLGAGGKFEYSPFAANCLTELYKLAVSLIIVSHMCIAATKTSGKSFMEEFKKFFEENLSYKLCLHVFGLTCMYVIVNLSVFGVMVHSTASNFFLLKASSPVITAIILVGVFGRPIHRAQWISIFAQSLGLISTQLDLCRGTAAVSWEGYFFIALNIAVSCVAGVWNEHIIKTMTPSVNAQNVVMYILGSIINFMLFYTPRATSLLGGAVDEPPPYFLYGFNNWKVIGVVIANGSVGLVITAVYKYADVVVKTFGIAGSVVTLYLLETVNILPSKSGQQRTAQGPIALLGATIVFLASYVYILPAPKPSTAAAVVVVAPQNHENNTTKNGDEELKPLKSESENNNDNNANGPAVVNPAITAANANVAPPASLNPCSWTRLEWTLLICCFFLGSILTVNKCSQ